MTRSPVPPDFGQRIYWPHSIAAIVAELSGQGINAAVALAGSGLRQAQLETHTTRVSYRQVDVVLRNALRLSEDPATALRAGSRMHITAYGMYGYALLSSATHAEAREFANRYLRVIGPLCDAAYETDGSEVACTLRPLHWPDPADAVHRFAAEFSLSAHLSTLKDLAGDTFRFSRVALDYPRPAHGTLYGNILGCPATFSQRNIEYRYERSLAEGPVALADARTHGMARDICDQLLTEVDAGGGLAAKVRRTLVEEPGQYPNIEAVAEKLSMHPRALRRKLEAEDTSYRELLAEVRMRLAIAYLRETDMTNEAVAVRLGYSDAANFRHAFIRWTGKSPSEFRVRNQQ